MSRLVACVFAAVVALGVVPVAASAAPTVVAQSSGDSPASPDIIPDPDGPARPANVGGLVVAIVLFGGWLVGSVLLFRHARRTKLTKVEP